MTPEQQTDLAALVDLFLSYGASHSYETIRTFAGNHDLAALRAFGWLVLAPGRWTTNQFVPAGALAARLQDSLAA